MAPKAKPKQIAPAKKWLFTLNNWENDGENNSEILQTKALVEVPLLIFQSEVGENGTPHLQGYLEFANLQDL